MNDAIGRRWTRRMRRRAVDDGAKLRAVNHENRRELWKLTQAAMGYLMAQALAGTLSEWRQ